MTAALEGGQWSAARPGRNLPLGKTPYPFYRSLGGPQGRSGRAENLVPTGIRSPDRPARSSVTIPTELPGPHFNIIIIKDHRHICSRSLTEKSLCGAELYLVGNSPTAKKLSCMSMNNQLRKITQEERVTFMAYRLVLTTA